jgi:hypothetical protein
MWRVCVLICTRQLNRFLFQLRWSKHILPSVSHLNGAKFKIWIACIVQLFEDIEEQMTTDRLGKKTRVWSAPELVVSIPVYFFTLLTPELTQGGPTSRWAVDADEEEPEGWDSSGSFFSLFSYIHSQGNPIAWGVEAATAQQWAPAIT